MTAAAILPPGPIAVLGAGTMGSGIAQACAQAGFSVRVRDLSDEMLDSGRKRVKSTLEGAIARKKLDADAKSSIVHRIEWTTDLKAAVTGATLVIEAIFEEEAQKHELFRAATPFLDPAAVVATNTSSLSVARLARGAPDPTRFAGLHFFFPAPINRLLEVIGGPETDESVLARLEEFGYRLRKFPIRVRDSAGFAVNRYFVPYLNEATRIVDEGLASFATVEAAGRELFGTSLGPFELMNVTGIQIAFHSETSLEAAFGPAYAPSPLLKTQFDSGRPWPWKESPTEPGRADAVRNRLTGLVFGIASRLVEEGVATPEATDRGATVGLRWRLGPFAMMNSLGLSESLQRVGEFAKSWGSAFPVSKELVERVDRREGAWPIRLVRVDRDGPIAWVLLDRPEVLNSLNSDLLRQLDEAFRELGKDADLRAVILAGSSPAFAAGADIGEMASKDLAAGRAFGFQGQAVCRHIEEFRAPVIALVEGYALGGGLELALACDFILAAENARLGMPEVSVGIHPGFGGASRLTRLIGRARTKYLVYTGRPISAPEAARLGFVVRVLPADSARTEARNLAMEISERAPLAIEWVKSVINRGMDSSLESALRLEGESAGHTFGTEDRSEGMHAFLQGRKPQFHRK